MKKAALALSFAALAASAAVDAWAGGRSGGHSGGYHRGGAHHFHHGARAKIFISSPFFFAPRPYYYYPAPVYPPAPVEYIQQEPAESQYWYYCPSSRAYYPYVNECPGGWQLVQPQADVQPSFPG